MEGRTLALIALSACALVSFGGCQTARELVLRQSRNFPTASDAIETAERPADDRSQIALTAAELDQKSELEAPLPDGVVVPPAIEPVPTSGETRAEGGWSLAHLQSMALENNPSIRQAASAAHKAMGFQNQVGLYPNPTAGYSGNQLFDAGTDQHTAYISQDIVTGGKLELNQCVLSHEVQAQLWDLETQRRRIQTDVEQLFYQTLAAQRRVELADEFVQIAEDAAKRTRERREKGDASEPDALQTEIQLNQVELERQQAVMSLRASWKQLAAAVGCPELAMSELVGELPTAAEQYDWSVVYQQMLGSSPEIFSAQASISRARANWERQEVQPIPNVSVTVAGGHDQATGSGLMNAQVGVPLPIWNRNQGNTYAAYSEYCRATQDLERRQLSIRSRLAGAARDYDSASVAVDKYQSSILPKAKSMLELSEQAYGAGEISYLQVLIVRRTYFESNLGFVDAQARLAASRALIHGLLLAGGLEESPDTAADDGLRDQALSGN